MPVRLASPEQLSDLLDEIGRAEFVAIDTEFHAEHRYVPELYLIQLRPRGGSTWIVDPLGAAVVDEIGAALVERTWLVHAGEQDLKVLHARFGRVPDVVLDTQIAAGLIDPHWPASYGSLVERELGLRLEKGQTLSDWSRRPLSEHQLEYAALDVAHLADLWSKLLSRLAAHDRTDVALAACAEARVAALAPPDETQLLHEIGAAATLDARDRVVLDELLRWREETARDRNQPPRSVASDGALVELARRKPRTAESLRLNRRLPKPLSRVAEDLVDRILRGLDRPESSAPSIVRKHSAEARRVGWLQVWAQTIGERERFASGLVLPKRLIDPLAMTPPGERAALRERLGWRDVLVGTALWSALQGGIALRLGAGDVIASPTPVRAEDPENF